MNLKKLNKDSEMRIGNQIIESFVYCRYKAYQKLNGKEGVKTDYELVQNKLYELYKQRYIENLRLSCNNTQIIERTFPIGIKLQGNPTIIINPEVNSDEFSITLDAIEIAKTKKGSKKFKNIPIIITSKERISKEDKIILTVKALLLNRILNQLTETGEIIYGKELKTTFIKTKDYKRHAQKVLDDLLQLSKENNKPVIIRNDNCQICEFEESCKKHLVEKDDLSLLGSLSAKEIARRHKKGLFTINQLSYNFRPKRFKRTRDKGRPFSYELKALAIRDNRTYILDFVSESAHCETEIYIDFEGLPDEDFVYLIGLIIKNNSSEEKISLWADSREQEKKIFEKLLKIIARFDNFVVYHYGSFEAKELKRVSKTYPDLENLITTKLLHKSVNLLSHFYSKVYTPTYTNGLKDIARFLGFKWSADNSTGIQSIAWRKIWELSNEDKYKETLLRYNIEDCQALIIINDWVEKLRSGRKADLNHEVGSVSDIKTQSTYKFGKTDFLIPDFEVINNCGYFNYQREKIFIRTNLKIKKIVKRQNKLSKLRKINKPNVYVPLPTPKHCVKCGNNKFYRHKYRKRVIEDLKFMINGIKRYVTEYEMGEFRCRKCLKITTGRKIVEPVRKNLFLWAINQYIAYGISFNKLELMLSELFNIELSRQHLHRYKSIFAVQYDLTYKEILNDIVKGPLLHIDETKVKVGGISKYVWILTNIDSVYYLYKSTREVDFLKELLKNFKGVLISDFYSGYDSIECPQQKCLIHFIRDLNDDLAKNPFDYEFKQIVIPFGRLLREIIETINKHGLKQRYLNKHKMDVKNFFSTILETGFTSDLAIQYQKRIRKNRYKLFTFMDYDEIPWNNNNAEHAIKHFARYRRNVDGLFSAKGIEEYLILLTIYQTCTYKGLNFLKFLLSGEKSIFRYFNEQYRFKGTPP